jgi:hypothetical protein
MWEITGGQEPEPPTECWETATYNETTCEWVITGEQPLEPDTECWETATFNNVTCSWEIFGEQPAEPDTECWETATFNDITCSWDVTGEQEPEPETECGEVAIFNETTCVWEITGGQEPAPEITCPPDVTVDCTADTSPASTGIATVSGGQAVTVDYTDGPPTGDGCVDTFTRTWTATDVCGNTSTCDQLITITDLTAPELVMPAESSIEITCIAVDYAMLLDYVDGNLSPTQNDVYTSFLLGIFIQNGLIPIGATDDCSAANFYETGIEVSMEVDCPAKATIQCLFVAEDACGNLSEPAFTELVVVDNTTPHVFCPADVFVTCGSDTSPETTGFSTATDNCKEVMEVTYEDHFVSATCPSSFVRIWTAVDDCGNVATCEQLITTVEEGDCVTTPNGLVAEATGSNSIDFSWNPVPNSVACRVFGRRLGVNENRILGTVQGNEPSELSFTSNLLFDELTIEWRVLCACDLSPLITTPYSPWTAFIFSNDEDKDNNSASSEKEQLNGKLHPNPTRSLVFITSEFEEGETLTVMELSGKVVGQYSVPEASGMFEIDLAKLEGGVYFIQHSGLDGRSQTFKVVKTN